MAFSPQLAAMQIGNRLGKGYVPLMQRLGALRQLTLGSTWPLVMYLKQHMGRFGEQGNLHFFCRR